MKVAISDERLHELAKPLGEAIVAAAEPILRGYATDESISPEEFVCIVLYNNCQSIASMIDSAPEESRASLREAVRQWLEP